jgi:hypothetical protein
MPRPPKLLWISGERAAGTKIDVGLLRLDPDLEATNGRSLGAMYAERRMARDTRRKSRGFGLLARRGIERYPRYILEWGGHHRPQPALIIRSLTLREEPISRRG